MKNFPFLILISLSILLISCDSNRLDVQLTENINVEIERFDNELVSSRLTPELHNKLYLKYGKFYQKYLSDVLAIGTYRSPSIIERLNQFSQDKYITEVYREVNKVHISLEQNEGELSEAFSYYKFHFPNKIVPRVVTCVSGFNYAMVATDSIIGVGLDMYLGNDCNFYPRLGIPAYKSALMTPSHLSIDVLKGWTLTEFEEPTGSVDMLTKMIYHGKILYLLDACFRNTHDSLKIGFSDNQLRWCYQNEFNLWAHFVDNKLLYTKNQSDIVQYTGEGPFTKGFEKVSPARTAIWVGWRIVRSYMNNNEQITLEQLMKETNAQKILTKSRYKPRN